MRPALALFLAAPLLVSAAPKDKNLAYQSRVAAVLAGTPLIDGHNDWAETLVVKAAEARWTLDLTRLDPRPYNTDVTRLRAGRVGGQFWSVYVSAGLPGPEQVKATLEQIALMKEIGQPDRAKAALAAWEREHPRPVVTLSQVAEAAERIAASMADVPPATATVAMLDGK